MARTSEARQRKNNNFPCEQRAHKTGGEASETFLLHHFLLTESAVLPVGTAARSHRNELHVCRTACPCNVGLTEGFNVRPRGGFSGLVRFNQNAISTQDERKESSGPRRELLFTHTRKRNTGNLYRRRHGDMTGRGQFISAFTLTPHWVSDRGSCKPVPGSRMGPGITHQT